MTLPSPEFKPDLTWLAFGALYQGLIWIYIFQVVLHM